MLNQYLNIVVESEVVAGIKSTFSVGRNLHVSSLNVDAFRKTKMIFWMQGVITSK